MRSFGFHLHAALAVLTVFPVSLASAENTDSVYCYYNTRGTVSSGSDWKIVTDGGQITPSQATFGLGRTYVQEVNFVANPPAGHEVTEWYWNVDSAAVIRNGMSALTPNVDPNLKLTVASDKLSCMATLRVTTISENVKRALGAYFDYIPLTVTFSGNGATSGSMAEISGKNYDSSFALTANAYMKTGYKFVNWTNDLGKTFADRAAVTGSSFWDDSSRQFHAALSAAWTPNSYTVTFNKNEGNDPSPSSKTVAYDSAYGDLATCTRTGYTFVGWYTAASGGTKVEATTKVAITAAQTLYAHWTPKTYTVTFDANGGGTPSPATMTVTYDSTYGTLPSPARTGYTLDGWYTAASGGTKVEATTKVAITAAQKLYAHWTAVSYTISYGGLKPGATHGNPPSYTVESDTITFASPSDAGGYKFVEWEPASIEKGSTGNKTVTAKYLTCIEKPTPSTYELTYNGGLRMVASGDNMSATGNQATDPGEYTASFTPNAGYCWTDGTTAQYSFTWKIVKAKISGASVQQTGRLTYTGEAQQPVVSLSASVLGGKTPAWEFSKDGVTFSPAVPSYVEAGTYTAYFRVSAENHESASGNFTVTVDRSPTAEVTLDRTTFVYTGKEQGPTATFLHCSEGATSESRKTEVGTYHVRATPDPNYSWKQNPEATYEWNFEWKIVEQSYSAQIRTGEGGTGSSSLRYTAGATNQTFEIKLPTRSGHHIAAWTADGWEGDAAPSVDGNVLTIAAGTTGDFTLTPTWEKNAFYVRYDRNGATNETEMAVQDFLFDVEQALAPNEYARTGYGFLGWATNATDSAAYDDRAVVSNLTEEVGVTNVFYAAWSTNRYTVTFDANGGSGSMEAMSFAYDESKPLTANAFVPPAHSSFAGWARSATGAKAFDDGETVSNLAESDGAKVMLFARWDYASSPLSEALDCDSHVLYFENQKSDAWVVDGTIFHKGATCIRHSPDNETEAVAMAQVSGKGGKLTFWWRGEYTTGDPWAGEEDQDTVLTLSFVGGGPVECRSTEEMDWTKVEVTVPAGAGQTISFSHSDKLACWIDDLTWTPDGDEPQYADVDTPVAEFVRTNGKFEFAFTPASDVSYHLLGTNDLVSPMPWPKVLEIPTGTSSFEIPVPETEPKMFYRIRALKQ